MPSGSPIVAKESTHGVESLPPCCASFRDRQIRVLEQLAMGAPLARTLETVVQMIQEQSPGTIASVLMLDDDGVHLRHGAAPDLPEEYNRAIDGLVIGASAGSCGTAAFRGQRVIVSDIATDPLWADYKKVALQHGLRSCWSEPVMDSRGKVLGTFAMYHRHACTPAAEDLQMIRVAAHLAGIAIERERAEREQQIAEGQREQMEHEISSRRRLEESEQRFRALAESANDGIVSADDEGRIIEWNRAARSGPSLGVARPAPRASGSQSITTGATRSLPYNQYLLLRQERVEVGGPLGGEPNHGVGAAQCREHYHAFRIHDQNLLVSLKRATLHINLSGHSDLRDRNNGTSRVVIEDDVSDQELAVRDTQPNTAEG